MISYTPLGNLSNHASGPVLYNCDECGSVVRNQAKHDKWHRELAAHSHHTLSVIGGEPPSGRVMPPGMPTIHG